MRTWILPIHPETPEDYFIFLRELRDNESTLIVEIETSFWENKEEMITQLTGIKSRHASLVSDESLKKAAAHICKTYKDGLTTCKYKYSYDDIKVATPKQRQ